MSLVKKPRPKKTFYDWVPVDPNEVEKPFAGKKYEEAAASREEIRALNASTPIHKVVKTKRLEKLGLTPKSRDPTGRHKIVVAYCDLGIGFDDPTDKWAVAPAGYCWCKCSDSDYYNYEWYELRKIPTIYIEEEIAEETDEETDEE
jgi:hypothetical protein